MKRFLFATLFFAVLLLIWEGLFRAKIWSPVLVPSPRQVAVYLEDAAVDGTLAKATIVTMRRLLIGYIIGLLAGLPLGLLTACSKLWQDTIGTLALGLQGLPSVCWVPLALLWFGQTEAAMLFVVVMGTLWAVVIATDTGVRHVPPIYRRGAPPPGLKRLSPRLKDIPPPARPAAEFVRVANGFRAEITLIKDQQRCSASSLIDVLRANLDCGASAMLEARGADAEAAITRLEKLLVEFRSRKED